MKISSASKKVLASALSAAMVVAFAPTVAFGKANDLCPVTLDAQGGTIAGVASYPTATEGMTITLPTATSAQGYALDYWWYDADGDGKDVAEEHYTAGAFEVPTDEAKTIGGITLKAVYKAPTLGDMTFAQVNVTDQTAVTSSDPATIAVPYGAFTADNTKEDADYSLTLKKGTTELGTWKFERGETDGVKNKHVVAAAGSKEINFYYNPVTGTTDAQDISVLEAGTYTAEISDGANAVATKTLELVKLNLVDGKDTTSYIYNKADGFDFTGISGTYVDADGYSVDTAATKDFTGEVTLTKSTATQAVSTAAYNDRVVRFTVADTASAKDDKYAVTVIDSAGAEVWSAELTAAGTNMSQNLSFAFGSSATLQVAKTSEVAGKYTIQVVKTPADTTKKASTLKDVSLVLTEFKVVAGEHTTGLANGVAADTFLQAGATITAPTDESVKGFDEGYEFDKVTLTVDGKEAKEPAAGKVNTYTVTAKATDTSMNVANPTIASATKALKKNSTTEYEYTVKVDCATAGATITYKVGAEGTETAYDASKGAVLTEAQFNAGIEVIFTSKPTPGVTDSKLTVNGTLTVVPNADIATFAGYTAGSGATTTFETRVGNSSTKWLAAENTSKAIADGKAAIEGLGYYYKKDSKTAADTVLAQYKALYEAVAADANAQLAPYADESPVVVDGKAYVIAKDTLKTATGAVADAVKGVTDTKAEDIDAETYEDAIEAIIPATNAALKAATESKTVTAADIEAAAAVDAAIAALPTEVTAENYEAVAKAAADAQTAYEALTAEGKKLVTADIQAITKAAAAAEAVKAQAELVDAQDEGTLNKLSSTKKKTVKLAKGVTKTKKAQSVAYTTKVSKSGNVVTYAKASGSSRITVKAAGTVTLKKATKKGTYTAKVKATCGTQTRTVTVKFVVK